MAGNDGNDSKNSGCMATDKHDSAGHDPDVQVLLVYLPILRM